MGDPYDTFGAEQRGLNATLHCMGSSPMGCSSWMSARSMGCRSAHAAMGFATVVALVHGNRTAAVTGRPAVGNSCEVEQVPGLHSIVRLK